MGKIKEADDAYIYLNIKPYLAHDTEFFLLYNISFLF